jgi:hypothetical protein
MEHSTVAESAPAPKTFLARNVVLTEKTIEQSTPRVLGVEKSKNNEISDSNQTASVITILPEEATSTSRGFIDTLISWPGRSLRFMRDLIF